ncbi:MAG: hypothetical protein ACI3W7_05045 [Oscillospiraceae bacterium]
MRKNRLQPKLVLLQFIGVVLKDDRKNGESVDEIGKNWRSNGACQARFRRRIVVNFGN